MSYMIQAVAWISCFRSLYNTISCTVDLNLKLVITVLIWWNELCIWFICCVFSTLLVVISGGLLNNHLFSSSLNWCRSSFKRSLSDGNILSPNATGVSTPVTSQSLRPKLTTTERSQVAEGTLSTLENVDCSVEETSYSR